jgi:hypothetical protein
VAVFLGIAFSGGGHGSSRPFIASLVFCALDGLLLLLSVIAGLQAERETPGSAPWLAVAIPLLLAAALLAIWGLAG